MIDKIKEAGFTVADVSKYLGCNPSNIYRWEKHGLSTESHYYKKLKELVPEITVDYPTTKKGKQSKKCNTGRKRKSDIILGNDDGRKITELERISQTFPKINIKHK